MKEMITVIRAQGVMMEQKDNKINEMEQNILTLSNKVTELEMKIDKVSNKTVEERLDHLEEMEKLSSVRSCYELEQYGIKISNTYNIDPDGPLIGLSPFPVFCNFEKSQTEVLHNHEYPVEIEHCEGTFCFPVNIDYGVPMSQLQALIDISNSCTQKIAFDCFLAPLSSNGDPVGVWVNRQGGDEYYFTGSNSGTHICECGINNNCTESDHGYTCNCDSQVPVLQEDAGVLTDDSALPVTAFKYGDLVYETTYATIEVGRLTCEGSNQIEPEKLHDSCKNLKINGQSQTGNFIMNDGKVSFCDFQKDINDPEIEEKIPWMRFNDVA